MPYPSMSDYREVLQNPRVAFNNPELKQANVKQTPLGLPLLVSGGFALTTCVTTKTNGQQTKWAIRCFHKEVPDLQERYQHISNFLQNQTDNFFVGFQYEPRGIWVKANWYPIVKMAWVEGHSLNEYIEDHLNDHQRLRQLADKVKIISNRIDSLKISHGDLQHGNILVGQDGNPILIDYDGMYVPGMPYKSSNEIGHINFQHPNRTGSFFDEKLDRFSTVVLYLSLLCLAEDPTLWRQYHTGENLIFSRQDYQNPRNSDLFRVLKTGKSASLVSLVNRFEQICLCKIEDIPNLNDFLNPTVALPQPIASSPSNLVDDASKKKNSIIRQFEVLDATKVRQIAQKDGEKITIVGKVVTAVYKADLKICFINFGNPWDNDGNYKPFTAIIFSQGIARFAKVRGWYTHTITGLTGKYVEITGLLGLYPKYGAFIPQIILEDPYQLKEITRAEYIQILTPSPPQPKFTGSPDISRPGTQPAQTPGSPSGLKKPVPPPPPPKPTVTQPPAIPVPSYSSFGSPPGQNNSLPPIPPLPPKPPVTQPLATPVPSYSSSGPPSVSPQTPLPPQLTPPSQPPVTQTPATPKSTSSVPKTPAPVASSGSSSQTPPNSSDPSSNNCFIVTATFGTPYAKEVLRYRRFRDEYLIKTSLGSGFIRVYYHFGPVLAKVIRSNPSLKKMMARLLSKLSELLPIEEE